MQTECLVIGGPMPRHLGLGAVLAARGPAGRPVRRAAETSGRPRERFRARLSSASRSATRSFTPGKKPSSRRSIWVNRAWRPSPSHPLRRAVCPGIRSATDSRCATRPGSSSGPWSASVERVEGSSSSVHARSLPASFRLTVRIQNQTPAAKTARPTAAIEALMHGLVSTHTVLVDSRWRIRLDDRSARAASRAGRRMHERRLLAGAGRRRGGQRYDSVGADHSLRLSSRSHPRAPASSSTAPRSTRSSRSGS